MAADAAGRLPLHWAALGGNEAAVLHLLLNAAPAAAVAADAAGRLPLHCAADQEACDKAVLHRLLDVQERLASASTAAGTGLDR